MAAGLIHGYIARLDVWSFFSDTTTFARETYAKPRPAHLLFTHTSVQNLNHGQDTNMVMIPVNTLAASTRLPLAAEAPYEATDLM